MRSIGDRKGCKGWVSHSLAFVATMLVAGLQFFFSPAWAGYELPPGERITNLPHIPRSMPNKESYEIYDPVIGRNFDIKNFWMRADLRVRPEWRTNVCFGGGAPAAGVCNGFSTAGTPATNAGRTANDFYVQQWVRLGIGYDLSPDVNFYFELIDSATWGGNGNPNNAGNAGDPLQHNCGVSAGNTQANCRLGVRAAYVLVRNMFDIQGLSMKAGRQYVIFGNHSLFGHFDWANTGYSHDGIMFQYATKAFESHLGWFRNSETDLTQGTAVGSGAANIAGCNQGTPGAACTAAQRAGGTDAAADADMFIFYNQIKNIPGIVFEPYYVLYMNQLAETVNAAQGLGTAKHSGQIRHMIGQRTELRKGGWDAILETAWQFGRMADGLCNGATCFAGQVPDNNRNLTINAWALRSWLGYTWYDHKWKPRLAFNVDYASGDGNANCAGGAAGGGGTPSASTVMTCKTANTFENFFPTNHIHMAYADVQAWKNMFNPQVNFQARPTERDHVEIWYMNMNLASARDNWYRAGQGPYVFSRSDNTKTHVGDEIDFTWTRMFADGNVALQATYGHIWTGGYMTNNLSGVNVSDQSWGFVQLWMNF
jgi:hypothetical protein